MEVDMYTSRVLETLTNCPTLSMQASPCHAPIELQVHLRSDFPWSVWHFSPFGIWWASRVGERNAKDRRRSSCACQDISH
eukprot:1715292-Amphidinium_carterae.1